MQHMIYCTLHFRFSKVISASQICIYIYKVLWRQWYRTFSAIATPKLTQYLSKYYIVAQRLAITTANLATPREDILARTCHSAWVTSTYMYQCFSTCILIIKVIFIGQLFHFWTNKLLNILILQYVVFKKSSIHKIGDKAFATTDKKEPF